MVAASQLDPSRTLTLRRAFQTEVGKRFNKLRAKVLKLIIDEDAFGLNKLNPYMFNLTNNNRWKFHSSPEQVEAFRSWLTAQIDNDILSDPETTADDWWEEYIQDGYRKGIARAFDDINKPGKHLKGGKVSDFYRGSRAQFLRSSFDNPQSIEKVKLLAGRTYTDLKGVTDAMGAVMARSLADGLARGKGPREIARDLAKAIDSIGKVRANTIARTEVIRAHAEAQLDGYEAMGMEDVGVAVEWATAGATMRGAKVCPLCRAMNGVVLKIKEARGMIPRHPNCRCAFIPANVGEDDPQKTSKKSIDRAITKSVSLEGDEDEPLDDKFTKTRWLGADAKIDPNRPESILNYNPAQPRDAKGQWTRGGTYALAKKRGMPSTVSKLEFVKKLGGSTGATLVKDTQTGKLYVKKTGQNPDHLRSEYHAENAYRAAGVNVPKSHLYETVDGPVKLSEYIEGKTLDKATPAELAKALPEIQKHFAVDVAMANWDVIGMGKDNILLDNNGRVHRIDVGGSLEYRAKGAKKGTKWNDKADEFETMRDKFTNASSASVFGKMSTEELSASVTRLDIVKKDLVDALPPSLQGMVSKRIDSIKAKMAALEGQQTVTKITTPTPPKPTSAPKPVTPATSPMGHLSSGDHVHSYLSGSLAGSQHKPSFTSLQLDKIKHANPNGVVGGKLYIPKAAASPENVAQLQAVLPPGTKIIAKAIKIDDGKATATATLPKPSPVSTPAPGPKAVPLIPMPTPPPVSPTSHPASPKPASVGVDGSTTHWSYDHHATVKGIKAGESIYKSNGVDGTMTVGSSFTLTHTSESKNWTKSGTKAVTGDQLSAVGSWKGSSSSIRKSIAKSDGDDSKLTGHAKAFKEVLDKAPAFHGVTYRGVHDGAGSQNYAQEQMAVIKKVGTGAKWVDTAPMCTSRNPEVAKSFAYSDLVMQIHMKSGASIEHMKGYSGEQEITARPRVQYRIREIHEDAVLNGKKMKMFVILEEI